MRAECTEYIDYPVTEWVVYITNTASVNSAVISDFCVTAEFPAEGGARLYHGNGDNCNPSGYSWETDELGAKTTEQKVIAFPELGMEALHLIKVDEYPAIIGAAHGRSIYEK